MLPQSDRIGHLTQKASESGHTEALSLGLPSEESAPVLRLPMKLNSGENPGQSVSHYILGYTYQKQQPGLATQRDRLSTQPQLVSRLDPVLTRLATAKRHGKAAKNTSPIVCRSNLTLESITEKISAHRALIKKIELP